MVESTGFRWIFLYFDKFSGYTTKSALSIPVTTFYYNGEQTYGPIP